ncbi:hypothetical protein AGMMS50268_03780 [Spirochaetia bacterium]|nr:hypothetical protein AGMMS50268_03780 [Spirochaetia bacterium]
MKDELTDDLFEGYQRKNFTAEDVFKLIDNHSVSKAIGVKLIEGYGLRMAGEAMDKMRKESGIEYGEDVEAVIVRVNRKLDKVLEGIKVDIIEMKPKRKGKYVHK